jgi:DNA-directed RNA polymerase specialized sigma24 family protein
MKTTNRVQQFLARLVGSQDCEDLTQTVFEKAAKGLPSFRGDAEIPTWLHRIAANVASDWLRSRSVQEARSRLIFPLVRKTNHVPRLSTWLIWTVIRPPKSKSQKNYPGLHPSRDREALR